ncbi:hypothetical protein NLI96_g4452 [Meripilus lineatus]|uniref:Uncharacterized protein n=1 Tax=Meripilus lineatus TaxID=2056292 RepID=A0AAD5V6J1_9APHY|nr:hypothetical protein NLI96_g4452 [Physisporinus lineatus]
MNAPIPKKAVSRPAAIDVQMVAPFHPSPSTPNLPGDNTFLSPPRNTFTSRPPKVPPRPSSAPPATTEFDNQFLTPTYGQDTPRTRGLRKGRRPTFAQGDSGSSVLSPPPPPLFRPTTFWRNTRRSGVTGASYSPSSHLIRRSTFIAAGLSLDKPVADLSALCVESRLLIPLSLPLLCIPQILASTVLHDIPPTPTFHVRRQYSGPDVTSSIDRWPDPTWGASTDSDATPSFHPEALAIGSDPDLALPRSTLSPASSVPSNKLAASSSTPLIHITALPAATTPGSKHRRLRHIKPFNTAYLAPIFALLGLSLGAIAGALLVRLRRYRQMKRGRVDSLEPGPKYTPPPGEESEDISISQNRLTEKNSRTFSFLGGRRLERRHSQTSSIPSWHGSKKDSWLKRVLGSRREGNTSLPDTRLSRANDRLSAFSEADPFLHTPHASRAPSSLGSGPPTPHGPVSPARALLSSSAFPPESALPDDEWGSVPHDSSMHKSIRRGILDHFKNGHRYRGGHKRADSDLNVGQVVDAVRNGYDPVPVVYDSPQRGRSLVRSGSIGSGLTMKKAVSGPGFRIVDEDPETQSQGSSWRWALPWSGTPKTLSAEDNLTPVPPRRSMTEKRSPRASPSHSRAGCSIETSSDEKALEKRSPQRSSSLDPFQMLLPPWTSITTW